METIEEYAKDFVKMFEGVSLSRETKVNMLMCYVHGITEVVKQCALDPSRFVTLMRSIGDEKFEPTEFIDEILHSMDTAISLDGAYKQQSNEEPARN